MSSPLRPSARSQAKNALEQIKDLEAKQQSVQEMIVQVVRVTDQVVQRQNKEIDSLKEMVNALVGLVGSEEVAAAVDANRLAAAEENAKQVQANIAAGLAEGKLVKAEKITERSIIVGKETDLSGDLLPPGYSAMAFTEIKSDFQEKLLGQAVGFVVDTETGGKFTVDDILERAPEAPAATEAAVPVAEPTLSVVPTPVAE